MLGNTKASKEERPPEAAPEAKKLERATHERTAHLHHHEMLPEKRRLTLKTPPASPLFTAYGVRSCKHAAYQFNFEF